MSIFKHITDPAFDKDHLVLAHFNKYELEKMDKAQGGKDIDPKTGVRRYTVLGESFKDPKARELSLKKARSYHANGGSAKIQQMKKHGRYGDTEVAYVPKHLADHMDKMIGGPCINPKTGHREYFLGALISGLSAIGRAAAPIASAAARNAGRIASTVGKTVKPIASTLGKNAGTIATTVGKNAVPVIKTAGTAIANNALPAMKTIGAGIARATPDLLNAYGQYQQQQRIMQQQNQLMNFAAGLAQNQVAPHEQYIPQQQYMPQEQQQFVSPTEMLTQNLYDPYAGGQMDYSQGAFDPSGANSGYFDPSASYYADGGRAKINNVKKKGRYGDTEVALVPSSLQNHFNEEHGGKTVNPKTGLQENFLGALITAASMIPSVVKTLKGLGKRGTYSNKKGSGNVTGGGWKSPLQRILDLNATAEKNRAEQAKKKKQNGATAPAALPQPDPNQNSEENIMNNMQQFYSPDQPSIPGYNAGMPEPSYDQAGEQSAQQPQQQPQSLVPDQVVQQRISGVMNRAPDIMNRMQQEMQGAPQNQY